MTQHRSNSTARSKAELTLTHLELTQNLVGIAPRFQCSFGLWARPSLLTHHMPLLISVLQKYQVDSSSTTRS